jgi:hypothetical protein
MREASTFTENLFSLRKLQDSTPAEHVLRLIRHMVNTALLRMEGMFPGVYDTGFKGGRPEKARAHHASRGVLQRALGADSVYPAVLLVHRHVHG